MWTIHFFTERALYIADNVDDVIIRLNLDNTSDVMTLFVNESSAANVRHPSSVAKIENTLFVSDWIHKSDSTQLRSFSYGFAA